MLPANSSTSYIGKIILVVNLSGSKEGYTLKKNTTEESDTIPLRFYVFYGRPENRPHIPPRLFCFKTSKRMKSPLGVLCRIQMHKGWTITVCPLASLDKPELWELPVTRDIETMAKKMTSNIVKNTLKE